MGSDDIDFEYYEENPDELAEVFEREKDRVGEPMVVESDSDQPIFSALEQGTDPRVVLPVLLQEGAEGDLPLVHSETGRTLAWYGRELEHGGSILDYLEFKELRYNLELVDACTAGDLDDVKVLIQEKGADPSFGSDDRSIDFEPLRRAIKHDNPRIAEYLLDQGADVTSRSDDMDQSILMVAILHQRSPEMIQRLIDAGADPNYTSDEGGITSLHLAMYESSEETIRVLLEEGAKPDKLSSGDESHSTSPLHIAAEVGSKEATQALLEHGADPDLLNGNGWSPLAVAIDNGHIDIVRVLLNDHNADPDACRDNDARPMSKACRREKKMGPPSEDEQRSFDILLQHDPEINYSHKKTTPLLAAAGAGLTQRAIQLLDAGADHTMGTENDIKPIHLAAREGAEMLVDKILARGADVDPVEDLEGRTPLYLALDEGHPGVAQRLLDAGADPEKTTDQGESPKDLMQKYDQLD